MLAEPVAPGERQNRNGLDTARWYRPGPRGAGLDKMNPVSRVPRAALTGLAIAVVACGGSSNPAAPTPPPVQTTTIAIATAGVSPKNIEVSLGTRVRFVNNDTRAHDMSSDPHPDHTDCPEINQVGFLQPGQSRETGNLVQARICGFHDHLSPSNQALTGSITIR